MCIFSDYCVEGKKCNKGYECKVCDRNRRPPIADRIEEEKTREGGNGATITIPLGDYSKMIIDIQEREKKIYNLLAALEERDKELAQAEARVKELDFSVKCLSESILPYESRLSIAREGLSWIINEFDCRDDDFGGVLFTRSDMDEIKQTLERMG